MDITALKIVNQFFHQIILIIKHWQIQNYILLYVYHIIFC